MSGLTDKQIKFLDELGKGPKGVRELLDDYDLTWREFKAWQAEPAFAEGLEEVFSWLEFMQETDIRIGATEALRRQRLGVCGSGSSDLFLTARQRLVGDGLWNKARQLYRRFPRNYGKVGSPREISPVHPDHLHEAHLLVQRMEALRRLALEAKAREKLSAAGVTPLALPAPEAAAPSPEEEVQS